MYNASINRDFLVYYVQNVRPNILLENNNFPTNQYIADRFLKDDMYIYITNIMQRILVINYKNLKPVKIPLITEIEKEEKEEKKKKKKEKEEKDMKEFCKKNNIPPLEPLDSFDNIKILPKLNFNNYNFIHVNRGEKRKSYNKLETSQIKKIKNKRIFQKYKTIYTISS